MDKIMIVESIEDIVEDGEVVGKFCSNSSGDSVKVKIGRGGHLKKKWDELQEGLAYSFAMGEYKGYPFVEDFTAVSETLAKKAPAKAPPTPKPKSYGRDEDKVDIRTALMEVGADYREGKRKDGDALVVAREQWLSSILKVTVENTDAFITNLIKQVKGKHPDELKAIVADYDYSKGQSIAQFVSHLNAADKTELILRLEKLQEEIDKE